MFPVTHGRSVHHIEGNMACQWNSYKGRRKAAQWPPQSQSAVPPFLTQKARSIPHLKHSEITAEALRVTCSAFIACNCKSTGGVLLRQTPLDLSSRGDADGRNDIPYPPSMSTQEISSVLLIKDIDRQRPCSTRVPILPCYNTNVKLRKAWPP